MTHSFDIVGYTHSDGYALCEKHANYGDMEDIGNESGKVYPIFARDEWDYYPSCGVCNEEIETSLTEDGQKWLADQTPVTYSILVGNLGWVVSDEENEEKARKDFADYVTISKEETQHMGYQEQVSLWASNESDPIEEYEPEETVTYRVLAGEMGFTVLEDETDKEKALAVYNAYVEKSKHDSASDWYQERVLLYASDPTDTDNERDPIEFYVPEDEDEPLEKDGSLTFDFSDGLDMRTEEEAEADGADAMHTCRFCNTLDNVDDVHTCLEFTDAANSPEGSPIHDLWEAVMNRLATGFYEDDNIEIPA